MAQMARITRITSAVPASVSTAIGFQVRLLIMGVIEKYRGRGIDAYFYLNTARRAVECGYKRLEGSWILETNTMMNLIIERLGGIRYKTYRIYEKRL